MSEADLKGLRIGLISFPVKNSDRAFYGVYGGLSC